jgi:hypothetical protein
MGNLSSHSLRPDEDEVYLRVLLEPKKPKG